MATLKDWVRSNISWEWIQANGYQTFREHDELIEGVDNGTITEEQLYHEDGFNFPRMPEGWKSFEEERDEKEAAAKAEFIAEHPELADKIAAADAAGEQEYKHTVVVGEPVTVDAETFKKFVEKKLYDGKK